MKTKFYKKRWFIIIAITVLLLLLIPVIIKGGIKIVAATYEVWTPDYRMENIDSILEKEVLTNEDYEFLYRQTGITRIGIDDMRKKGLQLR